MGTDRFVIFCSINLCIYVSMYVCMYACMYVSMYVCMYVSMYVCVFLCMYVCMYLCMYICMYLSLYRCLHSISTYRGIYTHTCNRHNKCTLTRTHSYSIRSGMLLRVLVRFDPLSFTRTVLLLPLRFALA